MSLRKKGSRLTPMEIGALGERLATEWLWSSRRRVLYRNFRAPGGGEVDIVMRDGRMLCFLEVKTRTKEGPGRPSEAVDQAKQALIERGAREWLRLLGQREIPCRYDVMEVILLEGERPKLTLLTNVF